MLSAFGALGPRVTVVTVLAGLPPSGSLAEWDALTGAVDSRERVAERRAEDRAALEIAGAVPVHLDFADAQYVAAGLMAAPSTAGIAQALAPLLTDDEVLAPAGIANLDHVLVRDAVLSQRPDAVLYADLPYALAHGFDLPADLEPRQGRDEPLSGAMLESKLQATRAYASQLPQLIVDFGDFLDAAGLGRERYW